MKLIYCTVCGDVVALRARARTCECGRSGGRYIGTLHAIIHGQAVPLGFNNTDFDGALRNQPREGEGERFTAFVIPQFCTTIKHEGQPN